MSVVHDVRGRSRRGARSIRRMLYGGLGLSPTVTAHWTVQRLRQAKAPTLVENSSFTWAVAEEDRTTLVWIHNYWSDGYGIDRPEIVSTLLDSSGTSLKDWRVVLEPDSTHVVDVREICRELGLGLPFEGELLMRVAHEKLFAGRPLQAFAEYVRDDGEATGVHGQYGLMRTPAAQVVGTMRVEARADMRTAVIVTNPYLGPGGPHPLRARLTVLSADGRQQSAGVPSVPSMGTRRVYLDEAFPNLEAFLEGEPGHFLLKLPCPSSRIANFIEYADGSRVANHGTIDRTFDQGAGAPAGWTASVPVASTFVRCDEHRDTVLSFSNNWGPIAADYSVTSTFYSLAGVSLATYTRTVPHLGFHHVSARELLSRAGISGPTVAHAEITIKPESEVSESPAQFDVLLGYYKADQLVAEVQVGAEFINGDIPPGVRLPDVRRTRVFGRVAVGDGRRTRVFLAHPSGCQGPYDKVAQPLFTLIDMAGTSRSTWQAPEMPPHSALLVDIDEIFPDARQLLGPTNSGTVRVRDTEARLFGYYTTETDGATTFPICHLIGG